MRLLLFGNRRIDVRSLWGFLSEREIGGLSSIFGVARKYGSGWIGQVILIGWKCSATLTVKLNYTPNKNFNFLSATYFISRSDVFCWTSGVIWTFLFTTRQQFVETQFCFLKEHRLMAFLILCFGLVLFCKHSKNCPIILSSFSIPLDFLKSLQSISETFS